MLTVLASIAAVFAAAIALNVGLHLPRARQAADAKRRSPPLLSVRGLIDEGFATALVVAAPAIGLLPQRPAEIERSSTIALLPEPLLPASASWLMLRRLRKRGWNASILPSRARPDDDAALRQWIDATLPAARGNAPITVIAIGGAGPLGRLLAASHPNVARAVTIASPLSGSGRWFWPAALRPGSAYLGFVKETDAKPRPFDAISLYSNADGWLDPPEAAYYPGAYNLEIKDTGHLSMSFSGRVFRYLHENLEAEIPERGTSA